MDAVRTRAGLGFALVSAATFGVSGPFGAALLDAGWTPLAVVFGRVAGAALILALPLLMVLLRGWRPTSLQLRATIAYGAVAVAGAQVCFFNAIRYLPVGVALLLEYLAPVLLLGWTWWRTGRPPSPRTFGGASLALVGLALVLDVTGEASIELAGLAWGLGAAVCLSVYFQLAAHAEGPPPLVMTAGGIVVGAFVVGAVGAVGMLPMTFSTADATLAGATLPWWAIVVLLAAVSTVTAYLTGIIAVGRLGSRIASFVGLTEVMFAVLASWWLVAERPTLPQVAGAVLIVGGITVIRAAERPGRTTPEPTAQAVP